MIGPKIILYGPSGSGKTFSLRTLAPLLPTRIIFTEPGFHSLRGVLCTEIPNGIHYKYLAPVANDLDKLLANILRAIRTPIGQEIEDPSKAKAIDFAALSGALTNFKCDVCGQDFGPINTWGPEEVLALDSLTGLGQLCRRAMVGDSLTISQPSWGKMMGMQLNIIDFLATNLQCWFILLAHVEKLYDEIDGAQLLKLKALGSKNAPEIPKNFTDMIYTIKDGSRFSWSTAHRRAETKGTYLPITDDLKPTFDLLHKTWKGKT